MMRNFAQPKRTVESAQMATLSSDSGTQMDLTGVCCGYLSNISDSEELDISDHSVNSEPNASHNLHGYGPTTLCSVSTGQWLPAVPLSRIDRFSLGPIEEGSKKGRDGSRGGRGSS